MIKKFDSFISPLAVYLLTRTDVKVRDKRTRREAGNLFQVILLVLFSNDFVMVDRSVNESYQQQIGGGGSRSVTQTPIALTRSVPSFNEMESRRRQQAAMLEDQLEGATALPQPGEYGDDSDYPSSHNPFAAENEVVIAGYENVTYEPSFDRLFSLSLNAIS